MDLIDTVARLAELEKKALPGPWTCRETAETEPASMQPDARYFSAMRIGTDADSAWHDRVFMADVGEWADLNLVIQLRNAAPALLGSLGAFHEGDADALQVMAEYFERPGEDRPGSNAIGLHWGSILRRLAETARKMEKE